MTATGRAWTRMSLTERAHELQVVMGACGIPLFPAPLARVIQAKLRDSAPATVPSTETRRSELARLPPQEFEAVFLEMLNPLRISEGPDWSAFGPTGSAAFAHRAARMDRREPVPDHLRHFEEAGYAGEEAVFMARFLAQVIARTDAAGRAAFERSVIGPGEVAESAGRWWTAPMEIGATNA